MSVVSAVVCPRAPPVGLALRALALRRESAFDGTATWSGGSATALFHQAFSHLLTQASHRFLAIAGLGSLTRLDHPDLAPVSGNEALALDRREG